MLQSISVTVLMLWGMGKDSLLKRGCFGSIFVHSRSAFVVGSPLVLVGGYGPALENPVWNDCAWRTPTGEVSFLLKYLTLKTISVSGLDTPGRYCC